MNPSPSTHAHSSRAPLQPKLPPRRVELGPSPARGRTVQRALWPWHATWAHTPLSLELSPTCREAPWGQWCFHCGTGTTARLSLLPPPPHQHCFTRGLRGRGGIHGLTLSAVLLSNSPCCTDSLGSGHRWLTQDALALVRAPAKGASLCSHNMPPTLKAREKW